MNHPVITIFCAFTRRWAVERWLENLASVEHDPAKTNLCFIVDSDEPFIVNRLKKFVEERNYRSFHYTMNRENSPNEVRIAARRMRIADVKNQSRMMIANTDGEIIIGLEDDTVFGDMKCFCRLIEPLVTDSQVGFVEGVQCGRWGVKMIGGWEVDNVDNPKYIQTVLPSSEDRENPGYVPIDGGGFYCYATRRELYLQHEYYTSSAQPWGPDVNFGLWVKRQGYACILDWQTIVGHNDHNVIIYPDTDLSKISFIKDSKTGIWGREDIQRAA